MAIALSIIGIWFALATVALCACVQGARAERWAPVRRPVINDTVHPGRIAA